MLSHEYEVGHGRVNPLALARTLARRACASPLTLWAGAVAWTLVILSWWRGQPVSEVVHWLITCIQQIL